ncbi:vitamin B12 ABC transporter permease BtuC, partial [Vibrio parahaemolyticus]|nr:vitamin B12 ABC transporter permease BtuC [Vibrio parahaemolyticus]
MSWFTINPTLLSEVNCNLPRLNCKVKPRLFLSATMDFQQLILNKERRWQRNLVIMSVVLVLLSTIHLMVGEVFLSPFQ